MRSAKAKAAAALKESAVASKGGDDMATEDSWSEATENSDSEEQPLRKSSKGTKRKMPANRRPAKRREKVRHSEEEEEEDVDDFEADSPRGSAKSPGQGASGSSEEDSYEEDKENASGDEGDVEEPPDAKRASCGMPQCDFQGKAAEFIAHYKKQHKDFKVAKCPQCEQKFRMLAPLVCHIYKECFIREETNGTEQTAPAPEQV